ncbi:dTMP kinase [Geothrix sp. PMB-07]|uniref:dTMP kinase n=1 Tax=Geothrix sp. PMB-07 TaxID=3068640 RepID=UPI002741BB00|nr:dTMP kinase [Geothrix sp. PMB-07]WLT31073.1 dTMP kinase [Geothrix sp. PMB-07]
MQGVFITIEGVEGSGKSTQLLRLSERLRHLELPVVVSKEPGGTALGRELRRLLLERHASGETWCPEAELLLFYADRAQHLETTIRPALAEGKIVLVDRFEDSTRAYQGASGVAESSMDRLNELVLRGLRPHLTVMLDMDPEASLQRVEVRNLALGAEFAETRFDEAELEFHRRVRNRFLAIAQNHPNRVALIPARDPVDQVEAVIWQRVAPLLRSAGFGVD